MRTEDPGDPGTRGGMELAKPSAAVDSVFT